MKFEDHNSHLPEAPDEPNKWREKTRRRVFEMANATTHSGQLKDQNAIRESALGARALLNSNIEIPENDSVPFETIRTLIREYLERIILLNASQTPEKVKQETILDEPEKRLKIEVFDHRETTSEHPLLSEIVSLCESFRPRSHFGIKIDIDENSIVIQMDPGSHKELIIVDQLENQEIVYFRHTPSAFERNRHREKLGTPRQEYVRGLIQNHFMRQALSIDKDKDSGKVEATFLQKLNPDSVIELIKIVQSLKDVDLAQNFDIGFAQQMYEKGVVNMVSFVSLCDDLDTGRTDLPSSIERILNEDEIEVLEKYKEYKSELESAIEDFRKTLNTLRRVREANYQCLNHLNDLGNKARQALICSEPNTKLSSEISLEYQKLSLLIPEMVVGYRSPQHLEKLSELIKNLKPLVEQVANIAQFGYGSKETLKHADGTVDIRDDSLQFLPQSVRNSYKNFQTIFFDRPGPLNSWEDISSIEEAIRFLHREAVEFCAEYGRTFLKSHIDSPFWRGKKISGSVRLLDIAPTAKTRIRNTVVDALKDLGDYTIRNNDDKGPFNKTIFAVLDNNYVELTIPTGKHQFELSAQDAEESDERTILVKIVDTDYSGSAGRQSFTVQILERMGFEIKSRTRVIEGFLKTSDPEWLHKQLEEIVRFGFSLKDRDLYESDEETINEDVRQFENGVVNLNWHFRNFEQALKLKNETEIALGTRTIAELGTKSEKTYLLKLLISEMKTFNKDLRPYLISLSQKTRDDLIFILIDLEKDAKKLKDIKLAQKYSRIADQIAEIE